MRKSLISTIAAGLILAATSMAANCSKLPSAKQLHDLLVKAPSAGGDEGGFFHGKREWAAVVNRDGQICAVVVSTSDPAQVWPGSLAIAEAKAYTVNAFSIDAKPMSTARLYTMTQPGHSLWGIAFSNPFIAADLKSPSQGPGSGNGKIEGGLIAFAGGFALYKNKKLVGGLGVSGDTACADNETAKRIRHMAGMDPPGGEGVDDIVYSNVDGPSIFAHPLCYNTWRNGKFIGNPPPASYPAAPPKK